MIKTTGGIRLLNRCDVLNLIRASNSDLLGIVRDAYVHFHQGRVINPHSSFLRLPEAIDGRIIALPAALLTKPPVAGIKWISSFPQNVDKGLERASAVIILNDLDTGFPVALLEGAAISAWRTALSACLVSNHLIPTKEVVKLSFIGCGLISETTLEALLLQEWRIGEVCLFDTRHKRARAMEERLNSRGIMARAVASAEVASAAELVVFATTAPSPWFANFDALPPSSVILNLSLRDLAPEIMLRSCNIVDDLDHVLRAQTSAELAADLSGDRSFISGHVGDLLSGRIGKADDRPSIFSPFGLGVLDVALANRLFQLAALQSTGIVVEDFFSGPAPADQFAHA